jgi:hypothetical protein
MTIVHARRRRALTPRWWSIAALALSAGGVALTVAVVFGPGQDPASVRWPLVVAPLVATAISVALPGQRTRIVVAVLLGLWCLVAAASVGLFFVPAAVAAALATGRRDPA